MKTKTLGSLVAAALISLCTIAHAQSTFPGPATPVVVIQGGGTPMGFQSISDLSTAVHLTVPPGATYALVTPTGGTVSWRDDGQAPAPGMPINVGQSVELGNLDTLQFIAAPGVSLAVSFYR